MNYLHTAKLSNSATIFAVKHLKSDYQERILHRCESNQEPFIKLSLSLYFICVKSCVKPSICSIYAIVTISNLSQTSCLASSSSTAGAHSSGPQRASCGKAEGYPSVIKRPIHAMKQLKTVGILKTTRLICSRN